MQNTLKGKYQKVISGFINNNNKLNNMNSDRIKEIQQTTAYPDSISVKQALLQVWNECEQEKLESSSPRHVEDDLVTTRMSGAKEQPEQKSGQSDYSKGWSDCLICNGLDKQPEQEGSAEQKRTTDCYIGIPQREDGIYELTYEQIISLLERHEKENLQFASLREVKLPDREAAIIKAKESQVDWHAFMSGFDYYESELKRINNKK